MHRFMKPLLMLDEAAAGGTPPPASGEDSTDYKVLYAAAQAKLAQTEADWQRRHGGLQTTFQSEQKARQELQRNFDLISGDLVSQTTQYNTLLSDKETLATTLKEKESVLNEITNDLKRKNLIMEKFPVLAPFEAQGLLPKAETDKLEEVLSLFSQSLSMVEESARKNYMAGAVPPAPPPKSETSRTAEIVLKEAQSAAIQGDQPAYQKLYTEYLALLQKK